MERRKHKEAASQENTQRYHTVDTGRQRTAAWRVKGGFTTRRRHKKILKMTKGQWGTKHRLFRRANEAMMKSYWYAYRDRRQRRRDYRRLWIARINAASRLNGMSYSKLIHGLKVANVQLDRKALADIAVRDAAEFTEIVNVAKGALA